MTLTNTFAPAEAVDFEHLLQRGIDIARSRNRPTLVSLSTPVAAAAPIDLFTRSADLIPDRFFWSPTDHAFTLVGLGATYTVAAVRVGSDSRFRRSAQLWQSLLAEAVVVGPEGLRGVGPLLLGGFAFDAQRPPTDLWQGYPAGRLVLPQLLFSFFQSDTWLTYNVVVSPDTDPDAESQALSRLRDQVLASARRNGHHASDPEPVILQRELRRAVDWQADVAQAAEAIRNGQLEKVVLARAVELQATLPFNVSRALRHLLLHYTGCYVFAIAHDDKCFLGATPERLIRLEDREVLTMSLAGSIKRGGAPDEDDRLAQTLLDSAKDRYEHAVVVQTMVEVLGEVCSALEVSPTPSILKLGNIQHICTTITGEIADGRTIFDLVEKLHPTPAVGGRPREAGLQLIRESEKLDRGWYAGPVGWVDQSGDGEFAVALRSALLHDHTATLFAGCGIMGDSDPEREYAESILKLKPMLAALGL
jgi:isochorismate synthase